MVAILDGKVPLLSAAVPPEAHTACSLTAVCPITAESWDTASLLRDNGPDPPPPMPLLFLPLILKGATHFALLDSGASDSFISVDVVKQAGLRPVPLKEPIRVRVANGQSLDVLLFVRVTVVVGTLHLRRFLRVITTHLPIVLGYPFLQQFNPMINWKSRTVNITVGMKTHTMPVVQAFNALHAASSSDDHAVSL